MQWVTREHVKVGRIACSWLISRRIDPGGDIVFLPRGEVMGYAESTGAIPFHSPGAEINHRADESSFEVLLRLRGPHDDPALSLLARIVNGADTDNRKFNQPEGPGLRAITDGLASICDGDPEIVQRAGIVFDALYAHCQEQIVKQGKRASVVPPASAEIQPGDHRLASE